MLARLFLPLEQLHKWCKTGIQLGTLGYLDTVHWSSTSTNSPRQIAPELVFNLVMGFTRRHAIDLPASPLAFPTVLHRNVRDARFNVRSDTREHLRPSTDT